MDDSQDQDFICWCDQESAAPDVAETETVSTWTVFRSGASSGMLIGVVLTPSVLTPGPCQLSTVNCLELGHTAMVA